MDNKLKIVMKGIDDVTPYWRNPRKNDKTVNELIQVIEKFGFNVPIVIDTNNVVVKGHARLKAAKRLFMNEIPCIVSYADEDTIKADRIADNKIQELSAWDFSKLETEYEKIADSKFERLFFEPEIAIPQYVPQKPLSYVNAGSVVQGNSAYEPDMAPQVAERTGDGGNAWADREEALTSENRGSDSPYTPVKNQETQGMGEKTVKAICPHCGEVLYVRC
jgi:hypothetical protein